MVLDRQAGLTLSKTICLILSLSLTFGSCYSFVSFTCFMMEGEGTHLSSPSHLLRKSSSPPRRSVRIIVVRHGQSEHNAQQSKLREQGMDWENIRQIMLKETDSQSLVDATLTPQGIEQAKEASKEMSEKYANIKYVFVSPIRRAVDTAMILTSNYPTKDSLEWRLAPWAREVMSYVSDLAVYSYEHLAKYPFIDRSALSANPRFWFLTYMVEDPHTGMKAALQKAAEKPNDLKHLARTLATKGVESNFQVQVRAQQVRQQIADFVEEKQKQGVKVLDDEILLVSHRWFLLVLTGQQRLKADGTYEEIAQDWPNCGFKTLDIVV